MKKKFLLTLMALVCALTCVCAFTACQEKEGFVYTEVEGGYEVSYKAPYAEEPLLDLEIPSEYKEKPVVAIGKQFTGSIKKRLRSVKIPDSVTTIADYAFGDCPQLVSVDLGKGVTSIGSVAFSNTAITTLTIPDCVTSIGTYAFKGCKTLLSVTLSENLTVIEERAFSDCENLSSIVIPAKVTTIKNSAFSSCWSMKEINVPDGVTDIGEGAFAGCRPNKVTLPVSVKNIGKNAFSGVGSMYDGSSVKENTDFAFSYAGTKTQWNAITKDDAWFGESSKYIKRVYCAKEDGSDGYDTVIVQR